MQKAHKVGFLCLGLAFIGFSSCITDECSTHPNAAHCHPKETVFDEFYKEATAIVRGINYPDSYLKPGNGYRVGDLISITKDKNNNHIIKIHTSASQEGCFKDLNEQLLKREDIIPFSFEREVSTGSHSQIDNSLNLFEKGLGAISFGFNSDFNQNIKLKVDELRGISTDTKLLKDYFGSLDKSSFTACKTLFENAAKAGDRAIILGLAYVSSMTLASDLDHELKIGNSLSLAEGVKEITNNVVNSGKLSAETTPVKNTLKYTFSSGKTLLSGRVLESSAQEFAELVEFLTSTADSPLPSPSPGPPQTSDPVFNTQGIFGCWNKQNDPNRAQICFGEEAILGKYPALTAAQKALFKQNGPHIYTLSQNGHMPDFAHQYEVIGQKILFYGNPTTCVSGMLQDNALLMSEPFMKYGLEACQAGSPLKGWEQDPR